MVRPLPRLIKPEESTVPKSTPKKESNFEQSLNRLEAIVEALEQGGGTLDEIMKMYEEGIILSKRCMDHLSQAELKLKRLSKDIEGNFELFDERVED